MHIAIIGGGVSGLATAFFLTIKGHQVSIYDKDTRLGGAAQTVRVKIGDTERWVDLGVNDFNAKQYPLLVWFLDRLKVPYKDLQDTESFSTPDGSISYTLDGRWNTPAPPGINASYERFKSEALNDTDKEEYYNYSIAQYLDRKGYPPDFGRLNIFPRVNGMYFAQDIKPEEMPFRGVMHYYTLQEGFGHGGNPARKYFDGGSGRWVEALAQAVLKTGLAQFRLGQKVQVEGGHSHATVIHSKGERATFDACVLACHADTARKLLVGGVTDRMAHLLSAFDYYDSVAVAHTYAPLLPMDKSAWRTYNITIHEDYEQLRPYSISYVCNLHQNDPADPARNRFEEPYFFVTLNPRVPIPDRYVLRTVEGDKAVAYFPHNIVSLEAMAAQGELEKVQGQNRLFFTGGWTMGAGLQEECLMSAVNVAARIHSGRPKIDAHYRPGAGEEYAPAYMRSTLGLDQYGIEEVLSEDEPSVPADVTSQDSR